MKILVTVKRIPDPDESLKFAAGGLDYSASKWVPNAFDEYAVETALRLAEVVGGTQRLAEVIVLSICPEASRQHVTQFLAMGADRGVIVDADPDKLDTVAVSKLIAAVFKKEACDLLIAGKLSQDNEGPRLASLKGITMAKRKPVAVLKPADLGVAASATEHSAGVTAPPKRKAGQKVKTVDELFEKLTKEAKVL